VAYTIQFNQDKNGSIQEKVFAYLSERMAKEGKFRATLTPFTDDEGRTCIKIKPVRLIKAKSYCGNHPGECVINPFLGTAPKKMNSTYLEWNDWVQFHGLVNRVLNRFRVDADVWSTPMDVRGKMWVRKGKQARKHYDWTEEYSKYGQPIRHWNTGDETQF
jgi:hypothetical protein